MAQPRLEDVIQWLPPDTETLLVVRGPGKMREIGEKEPVSQEVRYLAAIGLPGRDPGKARISYEFVVDGSRKFRPPKGLGLWPYQGCKIIGLRPAEHARLQVQYKKTGRRLKIEGRDVYEVSNRMENDTWTYQFAFMDGLMLCSTHRGYLAEVLKRRSGRRPGRALPDNLPEWRHIDQKAPLWVVRHFTPESNKAGGGGNMQDPKLIGYAISLSRDEKQLKVISLSKDPKGFEIATDLWQGFLRQEQASVARAEKLNGQATQLIFDGQRSYEGRLLFLLLAAVGHPVFI